MLYILKYILFYYLLTYLLKYNIFGVQQKRLQATADIIVMNLPCYIQNFETENQCPILYIYIYIYIIYLFINIYIHITKIVKNIH